MSILAGVTVGGQVNHDGQRIIIAGPEGVGKTTLACGAPNALLIPCELGFGSMQVARTEKLETWEKVLQLCEELRVTAMSGKLAKGSSIIWDSATALERMCDDYTIRTDPTYKAGNKTGLTMATAHGAYGKAYDVSNTHFQVWARYMDELAVHGKINVVVTCHVFAALALDPAHGEYNTWDLLLHTPKNQKTYGKREFMTQWADMIGFLHEPLFVMKTEKGQVMQKAVSSNQGRMLAVDRQPGWVAKNRYNLSGVIPIPAQNGWNYLADAIHKSCGIDLYNRSVSNV